MHCMCCKYHFLCARQRKVPSQGCDSGRMQSVGKGFSIGFLHGGANRCARCARSWPVLAPRMRARRSCSSCAARWRAAASTTRTPKPPATPSGCAPWAPHVQTPHSGGLFTLSMHTACSPAPGKPLQRTTALVGCIWLCWSQEFCSIPPKRVINSLFIRASPPRAPCPCARGAISVNDAGHPSAKCACLHTSKAKPSKTEPRCCSARST